MKDKKKNLSRRKFISAGIFLASLLSVVFFLAKEQKTAQASPNSTLYFTPAAITVNNSQTFSVDAKINPGSNLVSAIELHVSYDAAKFRLTGISNNSNAFPQILSAADINNTTGTASIILGVSLANPPAYVTTTSTVATFTFQAIGTGGTAPVAFASGTQASAFNENANVITTQTPSQVTIGKKYGNADFSSLAVDWLKTKTSTADVNTDGTVNSKDLGIMMSNWGS